MRVYVLHLDTPGRLIRAFDIVLDSSRVASCMVEPELCRVRFLAPSDCADKLVERIYELGGLRWCSRHEVTCGADALTSPLPSAPSLRLVDPPSEMHF